MSVKKSASNLKEILLGMPKVIEVSNLKKSYPLPRGKGKFQALKGISFDVAEGEIFGILGPNGAGKTTTLEIIEGLKQQDSGKVLVLGMDNILQVDDIKRKIGIQLQQSQYLHHLSLGELLDLFRSLYYPSRVQPRDPLSVNNKADKGFLTGVRNGNNELLKLVGLEEKEDAEFANLSGGQKQRFTIASSLVHTPSILFLDEPTTGLDPQARRQMWQLVKSINAQRITIVLTTHYMEEAEFLCNRVAILDQGKILKIDEPLKLIERMSDTTQVTFLTGQNFSAEIFKNISGVKKIHENPPKIIIEISSLDYISKIVEALNANKIKFSGFTVKTASLEDVYLNLTGHEYEE